ncbi:hypothetical protein [Chitinimonas taiwanensis]|uniref:Uncharacterized protein n=1 Tax=Chitinimonas taiwanensis DSM 18899 TaxID=1121279 RepID=A0A1K2HDQ3_9NEIS|nr:hypothetical protein [Chitinimonas taiwanensis]SFZ74940.1 hypothetical protein SAMN02745887_01396 [Chitinimonas taiwanensis DSM 18899]
MIIDVNKGKRPSPLKLTGLCEEVGLPVREAPHAGGAVITRMDGEALILDGQPQGSFVVGMGLAFQFVAIIFLPYMTIALLEKIFSGNEVGTDWVLLSISFFIALCVVGWLAFSLYMIYLAIFLPSPSPVIFNRRLGLVMGSHKGKPIALEWRKIKPVLFHSLNLSAGAQRHYSLALVERDDKIEKGGKQKKGYGLLVSMGYYGWANCHAMWEFIRCYMEDKPESLPEVELSPSGGFEAKMLDEGPYWEFHVRQGLMADLRYRNGRPKFNYWVSLFMVLGAPGFLVNVFRMLTRRRVQLPWEWLPAEPSEPNTYHVRPAQPGDLAIRTKAARYIALWMAVCLGFGMLFWIWLVRLIAF